MRIIRFIPDDRRRSRVIALARERHLPEPRCEGLWVIFEAVVDPEPVLKTLKAAGAPPEGG